MQRRTINGHIRNLAVSIMFAAVVGFAFAYTNATRRPRLDDDLEARISRQVDRLRSGPTAEHVLRVLGEDPEYLMDADSGLKRDRRGR